MSSILSRLRRPRRPRVAAPDLSWLDRKDGLPGRTRYDAELPDVIAAEAGGDGVAAMEAEGYVIEPEPQVGADEWSSLPPVFAPHSFVGGDLAAMAAPLPGMARDDLGTYAVPVESDPLYQVGPDGLVTVLIEADVSRFRDEMAHAARHAAELTEPVKPHGRHRQTDPADLILADLRDLDGLS